MFEHFNSIKFYKCHFFITNLTLPCSFILCNNLYAFSSERIDVQRHKTIREFVKQPEELS